jgi:DNA polymerase-3 subunit beta
VDFTADKVVLSKLLAKAASAAAAKSPIPALTTVKIVAGDNVTASGTDGFVGFSGSAPATVKSPGAVAVDAKRAAEVARTLPTGNVRVRIAKDHVEFSGGKAKLKLPMLPAEECVPLPERPAAGSQVFLADSAVMLATIDRGGYAVLPDESRPHMAGTLLEANEGGTISVVSTDGARMSVATSHVDDVAKPQSLLLSSRAVGELKRLLAGSSSVSVMTDGQNVFFEGSDFLFNARLVEAAFPPWKKVMPTAAEQSVSVDRTALTDAIKRVSAAASDTGKTKSVDLQFSPGQVAVTAEGATGGSGEDAVECECTFDLKLRVNPFLVEQALNSIVDDEARLELNGAGSPLVIKSSTGDTTAVIMPLRE